MAVGGRYADPREIGDKSHARRAHRERGASKGGHPFVRVSVQPCFTGIDAGEGKEEDDELDELSKLEKTLSKDDNE